MRILFLTQYYWPEVGAASQRLTYFARYLVQRGHKVTVLCSVPNYPEGKTYSGYRTKFVQTQQDEGVTLFRCWTYIDRSQNTFRRVLHYFSFTITSFLVALFQRRADIIFVSSPPLFLGMSVAVLGRIKRIPFVFDIRDVWPESAVAVGMMREDSWLTKIAGKMERLIYRASDHITVTCEGIARDFQRKGVARQKISFLPSGSELDIFEPVSHREKERYKKEFGVDEQFVVTYAGNIGLPQNPEILVECAKLLCDRENIAIFVIGEGVLREKLERRINSIGLRNLRMFGRMPRKDVGRFYAMSDIGLVLMKNSKAFKNMLPAKLFDLWAAGLPIIINLRGEAADLVEKAQSGVVVKPDDPAALAEAILEMKERQVEARKMGQNGRSFLAQFYDRKVLSEKLEQILMSTEQRTSFTHYG